MLTSVDYVDWCVGVLLNRLKCALWGYELSLLSGRLQYRTRRQVL